jgi:cell division protein YceG involved in septum cleavage
VPNESKNEKKSILIVAIILLLVVIIIGLVFAMVMKDKDDIKITASNYEPPIVEEGSIEKKSVEQIKQELQTQVDQSIINMYLNATPSLDSEGFYNIGIESNQRNINNYIVEIVELKNEKVIWKSPLIEPNHHIKKAKMFVDLPKGSKTKCLVIFHGYSRTDNSYLGDTFWKITMYS